MLIKVGKLSFTFWVGCGKAQGTDKVNLLYAREVEIHGVKIMTINKINVLGIIFDSNMKWNELVSKAIRESNSNLYGIRMIKKYFKPEEIKNLLTAIYYSKLY